jgi:hypothetical protein
MDFVGSAILASILIYGVLAFQSRHREYRQIITNMGMGIPARGALDRPALWRLCTLGSVGLLLVLGEVIFAVSIIRKPLPTVIIPIVMLGILFALLLIFVVLMFIRDVRAYASKAWKEE